MTFLSKIIWSEGMHLAPHHFQAQSRYFEDSIRFARESLWCEAYGYLGYQIDADALRNGTVSVQHARGVFPDGLSFDMPDCDSLVPARNIAENFPPTLDRLIVSLAVPQLRPEGQNCVLEAETGNGARFVGSLRNFHDDNTGLDEKPVRIGRKNIRLLLETEDSKGMVMLPLACITRDGAGHFVYDRDFIPPCLRLTAGEPLMRMLRRLIEILEEKAVLLSGTQRKAGAFQAGMSSGEIAGFWFLHTINASLAPLRHLYMSKRGHPEELYREMARLAGALCTFGFDVHPASLPAYDHDHLQDCFQQLDDHIRRHLEIIIPTQALFLPLQAAGSYSYEAEVSDQRCLDRARWILGVHSPAGEAGVIDRVPRLCKICSAKFLPELVKRALPGLALSHIAVPPAAISARPDFQYFSINRVGPCWEHIVQTRKVGVYIPGEVPSAELQLIVVLDTQAAAPATT